MVRVDEKRHKKNEKVSLCQFVGWTKKKFFLDNSAMN